MPSSASRLFIIVSLISGCRTHESISREGEIPAHEQYVRGTVSRLADSLQAENMKDPIRVFDARPTPFAPSTSVNFHVPREDSVVITFFDAHGNLVSEAYRNHLTAGNYRFTPTELEVNSEILYIRIQVGKEHILRKTLMMK